MYYLGKEYCYVPDISHLEKLSADWPVLSEAVETCIGQVLRNRKKNSQIIKDYFYLLSYS
jgi:hypothetical protein